MFSSGHLGQRLVRIDLNLRLGRFFAMQERCEVLAQSSKVFTQ
jgi:hypothetical protein